MKGTILQPTYIPWIGYFELIKSSDIYVVLDHVQFNKQSWQHRNKIKTYNGIHMLTIPISKKDKWLSICNVRISYHNDKDILRTHWKTIKNVYHKALYFREYEEIFEKIYSDNYIFIKDLNIDIIKEICNILEINTKIIYSSKLNLNDSYMNREEKLVNLCKKTGIDYLYEPAGGKTVLDLKSFKENGIKVEFQNFIHPIYNQLYGEFISHLSIIDMLFNERNEKIKKVFTKN